MTSTGWNPWKMTAIGLGLIVAVALITGVVVANWSGRETTQKVVTSTPTTKTHVAAAQVAPAAVVAPSVGVPSQAVIDACNQQAAQAVPKSNTTELVKDGAIGAVVGAAVGAAGGAIVDGGSGAGKGAVIGGVLGAGGGALYGVNENRKTDERYRAAYASCLRSRGYAS
jgi:hypothetical protein